MERGRPELEGQSQYRQKPNAARLRRKDIKKRADMTLVAQAQHHDVYGKQGPTPDGYYRTLITLNGSTKIVLLKENVNVWEFMYEITKRGGGLEGWDVKGRPLRIPAECIGSVTILD